MTFPMPGRRPARLAWRALLQTDAGWLDTVVDAGPAACSTAPITAPMPVLTARCSPCSIPTWATAQIVSFSGAAFDNAGWVTDRATAGNNANAYQDLNNDDVADYQPQTPAFGDPAYQHFDFPFADAFRTSGGTDVTTDRDAAVDAGVLPGQFPPRLLLWARVRRAGGQFSGRQLRPRRHRQRRHARRGGQRRSPVDRRDLEHPDPPGQRPRMEITPKGHGQRRARSTPITWPTSTRTASATG